MSLKKSESRESTEFLSRTAQDYYVRHGQRRGIEKFFRGVESDSLHKLSRRVSSESSIQSLMDDEDKFGSREDRVKSMSDLKLTPEKQKDQEVESSEPSSSSEAPVPVVDEGVQVDTPQVPPEVKNVNVNVESKVDVNLPPSGSSQAAPNFFHPTYIFPPPMPPPPPPKVLYCMETQTSGDVVEDPIMPVLVAPAPGPPSLLMSKEEVSPNSSVASKDQKLEWDSMADIGYIAETDPFKICEPSELGNTEKRALKRYFDSKGIKMGSNVVVVKNTPKKMHEAKTQSESLEFPRPLVLEETPKVKTRSQEEELRLRQQLRDRWKEVYMKYKEKYQESGSQTTLHFETPTAKSTPKVTLERGMERSVQTSLVDLMCKSVQVDEQNSDQNSCKSSTLASSMSSENFVYVKGSNQSTLKPEKRKKRTPEATQTSSLSSNASHKSEQEVPGSFEEELKLAIALLNSVLESKTMHTKLKKSLVSKIMQKIVDLKINNTNLEEKGSQKEELSKASEASGVSKERSKSSSLKKSLNQESSKKSLKQEEALKTASPEKSPSNQDTISSNKSMVCYDEVAEVPVESPAPQKPPSPVSEAGKKIETLVQESLQPMTHSEIDFQLAKDSRSASSRASKESMGVVSYVKKEKLAQLLWIEKEIEHLRNLKKLLTDSKGQQVYENVDRTRSSSEWGSHANAKDRSRLQTPQSEESIAHSMEQRKEEFVKNYEAAKRPPIYTKPYSLYSKPSKQPKEKSLTTSSDDFLSSGSISIPGGMTVTNTTTHQYDLKASQEPPKTAVSTQTGDSILRTTRLRSQEGPAKTLMVRTMKADKQLQTKPQALAYNLTFEEAQLKPREVKKTEEDFDVRTLKEHLNEKRPQVWGRMDERNECIRELRRLRACRNEARKKLLLLTSEESLKEKMAKLPPPPLSQKRLFSTKALRLHTQRTCQNLSEVQRKKELDILNNLKKKNRLITGFFNKNLQRKVLRGQVDLSNSVHLFSQEL